MRKALFTFLAICFLAGISVAGALPVPVAHAQTAVSNCQTADWEHPRSHDRGGNIQLSCCAATHCPMLGQGVLPAVADAVLGFHGLESRPAILAVWSGIANPPSLRPPRSIV